MKLEFLTPDQLKQNVAAYEVLSPQGLFRRPAATLVSDLSGGAIGHAFNGPMDVESSEIVWAEFQPGVLIRGTAFLIVKGNAAICPRQYSERSTQGFVKYVASTAKRGDPNSQFFANVDSAGEGLALRPSKRETIAGDVLWVTPDEPFNWGMWLLQTLPAIRHAQRRKFRGKILCYAGAQWQVDFLRFFAPEFEGRFIFQDLDCEYETTGRLFTLMRSIRNLVLTDFDRTCFNDLAMERADMNIDVPAKLFVSRITRSTADPMYRSLINEAALISALGDEGYVAIEPEKFNFGQQIAMFQRSVDIVGLGGAAMFSAVFCRIPSRILTIESSATWVEAHVNLFASKGICYGVMFGRQVAEDLGAHKRWSIDVDAAMAAILGRSRNS